MAGSTANPRVWLNADVYVAPLGTTAPTDTTTAWIAAWKAIGLMSEDGLTQSESASQTTFYAYGGILVRSVKSKHVSTFKVVALEDNAALFGLIHPGSTQALAAGVTTRTIKLPTPNPQAFGFEFKDGSITQRIIVPRGEVTTVGDVKFSDMSMATHELTVSIYPSATQVAYTILTDDPQATV